MFFALCGWLANSGAPQVLWLVFWRLLTEESGLDERHEQNTHRLAPALRERSCSLISLPSTFAKGQGVPRIYIKISELLPELWSLNVNRCAGKQCCECIFMKYVGAFVVESSQTFLNTARNVRGLPAEYQPLGKWIGLHCKSNACHG